ncbi:MAG: dTDP-glucose 4,6-dehydratase [Candidatus Shapirobacteria bacterium]
MKLLVTGGLGFIGTNFIRYWWERYPQDHITNLDKITYAANPQNLKSLESSPNYTFIQGDILDADLVNKLVSQVDLIVHFAAESHVDRSIDDPLMFVKTNVLGTYTLLKAALINKTRFHHISTDEVYGTVDPNTTEEFSETTSFDPTSPYAASKASSDHFVLSFFKTFGLPITITNCSNNYGPYQNPEKLIPRLITNLVNNSKIPVYGKGENIRDWLYVTDHCRAIEAVVMKGIIGETYCIGGLKESCQNIDIVKKIINLMGKSEDLIEYVADRPAHDNYRVSWKKINETLGWEPKESLETGLKKTIDWYLANTQWWQASKAEAEEFYKKLNNFQANTK